MSSLVLHLKQPFTLPCDLTLRVIDLNVMNFARLLLDRNPSFELVLDSNGTYTIVDTDFVDDDCDNIVDVDVYLDPAGEPDGSP